MKKALRDLTLALAVSLFALTPAIAADLAGSKDPDFLKRYEGSTIISYQSRPFDSYKVASPDPQDPTKYVFTGIEGQITRIFYQVPPSHTVLELLRNYEQALDDAGFARMYELAPIQNRSFGDQFYLQGWQAGGDYMWSDLGMSGTQQMGYVSGKATKDGKDITVAVFIVDYVDAHDIKYESEKPFHFVPGQVTVVVDVVTAKAVENKMVMVKAADMADALATKGSIALYGIYFDVDKTDIKPTSTPTLDEVANLLKIDRSLKLEISGHTDNTGDKAHNQTLSEGRANAVVQALVTKYGIDASRLKAKGYGDTKPVASNDTDDGKSKNRRVELTKQ